MSKEGITMEGLIEGRIVHYVTPPGRIRPAIVVQVWRDAEGAPPTNGVCNLQVFTDGSNDGPWGASGVVWATSAVFDADGAPGTWHWPPRA